MITEKRLGEHMIICKHENIAIAGIAAAVSNNYFRVQDFKDGTNDETIDKFVKMTGVQGRYNAGLHQTTSDFCCAAARELMEKKNVAPEEIGALVFVSQTTDYCVPASACVLQNRLGLSTHTVAFDVNLGCSGYVYGLSIIASLMANSNITKALLLAGDTSAKEKSPKQMTKSANSFKMLFGDSGTATLLEKRQGANPMTGTFCTDGSGFKAIIKPYTGWRHPDGVPASQMDDIAVFNFTISDVPVMIREFLEQQGTTIEDYTCFVPHQANLYILKQLAKRAKVPMEKVLISIDTFGNTSSSSIPISLVKQYGETKRSESIRALMCGFGVGLSWGIIDACVDAADILPLIHTDEYFDDGYADE